MKHKKHKNKTVKVILPQQGETNFVEVSLVRMRCLEAAVRCHAPDPVDSATLFATADLFYTYATDAWPTTEQFFVMADDNNITDGTGLGLKATADLG